MLIRIPRAQWSAMTTAHARLLSMASHHCLGIVRCVRVGERLHHRSPRGRGVFYRAGGSSCARENYEEACRLISDVYVYTSE